jgi:hypothetical protein
VVKIENISETEKEIIYQMYGGFSNKQLLTAIKDFSRSKGGLYKSRKITDTGDIDLLTREQKNMALLFLKRIKDQWKVLVQNLCKKKVKNKYRLFFLRKFGSLIETENIGALVMFLNRTASVQGEQIIFHEKFFNEDLRFFIEKGNIKVKILLSEPVMKKAPTLEELKNRKRKKVNNIFYLGKNLEDQQS